MNRARSDVCVHVRCCLLRAVDEASPEVYMAFQELLKLFHLTPEDVEETHDSLDAKEREILRRAEGRPTVPDPPSPHHFHHRRLVRADPTHPDDISTLGAHPRRD